MEIISALVLMLVLGGVIGLGLGFAGTKLHVDEDTRVQDILEMLPGYNCGGCGNPGCSGMAEALVAGTSKLDACKPCKPEQREKLKAYLAEHGL